MLHLGIISSPWTPKKAKNKYQSKRPPARSLCSMTLIRGTSARRKLHPTWQTLLQLEFEHLRPLMKQSHNHDRCARMRKKWGSFDMVRISDVRLLRYRIEEWVEVWEMWEMWEVWVGWEVWDGWNKASIFGYGANLYQGREYLSRWKNNMYGVHRESL